MASLQERNGVWNCIFRYQGKRHWYNIGAVAEAQVVAARVDYLLLRLKQHLLEVPAGCDIVTFIEYDGKPPSAEKIQQAEQQSLTLTDLREKYLAVHGNGTLEATTLDGIRQHFKHWLATLGKGFLIGSLTLPDLQKHVDRRAQMKGIRGKVSPSTIKKEIVTLRTCWNWGVLSGHVTGKFPNKGLRYARMDEKPPFMTRAEVERQIAAGADPAVMWESVYLLLPEIEELLDGVQQLRTHPFVYPMFCFAAHTGARRSEILRTKIADLDFEGDTILIHEKKRVKGKSTTRRVAMSTRLKKALLDWLEVHPGGAWLFCHGGTVVRSRKRSAATGHKGQKTRASTLKGRMATVQDRVVLPMGQPLTRSEFHFHFKASLAGTKWEMLRGAHAMRHSFASNLAMKSVDQRIIDDLLGHTTEEMKRRYRHLAPSSKASAIKGVFG